MVFLVPGVFAFLCFLNFLFVIFLFTRNSNPRAKVLSNVPKCKKAARCLMAKICVLANLHLIMSHSNVGHEFNGSESTIHIKYGIFKQNHP